ncbi:unnamed protein product [Nezara viridula]|uniref:Uncharacterized protein n=1 Tax=Nezara viridula TaxID=85310 RepID=A0A9P0HPS7_NEZVI|nr:unnamed protein product [Nezara viridula]
MEVAIKAMNGLWERPVHGRAAVYALGPTRGNKCLCERRPFKGDKAVLAAIQEASDRSPGPRQMALHSPSANSHLAGHLRYCTVRPAILGEGG